MKRYFAYGAFRAAIVTCTTGFASIRQEHYDQKMPGNTYEQVLKLFALHFPTAEKAIEHAKSWLKFANGGH